MTDIAERTIDTPSRTLADPPPAKPEGNPGLIALPLIIAGATGLGLINTGIVNVAAAAVPILLSATAIGLLVTTIWSAALSQNVNATIYGTFFGFYGSYAVLSLGLTHNWFGIPDTGVQQTLALWLGSWLLTIGLLTVLVLRLPWTFPVLTGDCRCRTCAAFDRKPDRQCRGDAGRRMVRIRVRGVRHLLLRSRVVGGDRRQGAAARTSAGFLTTAEQTQKPPTRRSFGDSCVCSR